MSYSAFITSIYTDEKYNAIHGFAAILMAIIFLFVMNKFEGFDQVGWFDTHLGRTLYSLTSVSVTSVFMAIGLLAAIVATFLYAEGFGVHKHVKLCIFFTLVPYLNVIMTSTYAAVFMILTILYAYNNTLCKLRCSHEANKYKREVANKKEKE